MRGTYDLLLVALSFVMAVCVSYTALNLASRVSPTRRKGVLLWLIGGAFAMGIGIWSMHFIGMLAFSLPIPITYGVRRTLLSLAAGIVVSAFALVIASRPIISLARLSVSSVAIGLGLAGMHYCAMSAIQIVPMLRYEPVLVAASIAIAVATSFAVLWLFQHLRSDGPGKMLIARGVAALAMGAGFCGMHYTAMLAARFSPGSYCFGSAQPPLWLAITIGGFAMGVLLITMILIVYDARLEAQNREHAVALEHLNDRLLRLATHDALTGLPNRLLLGDRLSQAIAQSQRDHGRFALLALDLDGFKLVNDSMGHQGGDELLRQVAQRLRDILRIGDTLARVGGDEFVIILMDVLGLLSVETVAARILATIGQPFSVLSVDVHTSPSIGISIFPDDGESAEELLVNADGAMYHAKKAGRNTSQFFTSIMSAQAQQRFEVESGLRRALMQGEFELYYQPKVDIVSGRIGSAEALLRWQHPQRGLVLPADFIPIAEETGQILQIGNWVLHEACRQARRWQHDGLAPVRIAINVSAQHFRQKDIVTTVQRALQEADLDPKYLELEITETAIMKDAAASAAILAQLSRIGVHISIDDFGTGYSSLSYLRSFPLDKLKIDRSFIRNLPDNADDAAIVSTIVSLAHGLRLKVVAEGVETREQLDFLRLLGCDQYQGYYCSKPVPADAFAALMRSRDGGADSDHFDPLATISRLYVVPRTR